MWRWCRSTVRRAISFHKSFYSTTTTTTTDYTHLLSFYGSLSVKNNYTVPQPFLTSIPKNGSTYWHNLLSLAADKSSVHGHHSWNDTDLYWILRALLENIAHGTLGPNDPRLNHLLSQATSLIHQQTPTQIQLVYLQTLLSLKTQLHLKTLVHSLSHLLESFPDPHTRFLDILWHVIKKRGAHLDIQARCRILEMVCVRLDKFALVESDGRGDTRGCNLAGALGTVLFPSYTSESASSVPFETRRWATEQAKLAFAPTLPWETRWENLMLLAIHRAPHISVVREDDASQEGPREEAAIVHDEGTVITPGASSLSDWRPVLVLSSLEQSLDGDKRGATSRRKRTGWSTVSTTKMAPETRADVRNIVRPLWRGWKATTATAARPLAVSRSILTAFFRMAARAQDTPLTEACWKFGVEQRLLHGSENDIADVYISYVLASAACKGTTWQTILDTSPALLTSQAVVVNMLLTHFASEEGDGGAAHGVYVYATQRRIPLYPSSVRALGLSLATARHWHLAVPLLDVLSSPSSYPFQILEELLIAILRVFQVERLEYVDSSLAGIVGDALSRLYVVKSVDSQARRPEERFKYPIRFFFCILIASGHPSQAIRIVEAIHHSHSVSPPTTPTPTRFFTTRFFLRLMRTLVRYQHLDLTERVLALVPAEPVGAAQDFRRKLVMSLARAGAHVAAKRVFDGGGRSLTGSSSLPLASPLSSSSSPPLSSSSSTTTRTSTLSPAETTPHPRRKPKPTLTARDRMTKSLHFKTLHPPLDRPYALSILPHLSRRPTDPATIRYAALLLVRARRTYAARKLLERSREVVSGKVRTEIGNMILGGYLDLDLGAGNGIGKEKERLEQGRTPRPGRSRLKNGRLVRHVVRVKETLEKDWERYGFVPDRVTTNVVVKAVLRWRAVGAGRVREMFDYMVRCGYPVSERWRLGGADEAVKGVPFGTPSPSPSSLSTFSSMLPALQHQHQHQPSLSFSRHVRPLYKMFAKAFYVRGDVWAARRVLGVLKEEEVLAVRRREERNRARREGLVRKKKRRSSARGGEG